MFKSVHYYLWAFDIEWVPDAVAGRKIYDLPETLSEKEVWDVMWKEAGGDSDNPRPFLKTALCRIVSIAAVVRKVVDGRSKLLLMSLPDNPTNSEGQNEARIIQRFLDGVGRGRPQLVGYNSINADVKILIQRGVANGINAGGFSERPNKPWEGFDYFSKASEGHVDLSNIVGGWGKSMPSLNEMATISGIPGKLDMSGSDVADKWLDGELEQIVQYNELDALTTYLLWLRLAHFGGHFNDEEYRKEQQILKDLLLENVVQNPHLQTYLDHWTLGD